MELPAELFKHLFDSQPEHIALVDESGCICSVNAAWKKYGQANNADSEKSGIGINYLDVCRQPGAITDKHAIAVVQGITRINSGNIPFFSHEYPCHSPDENYWFLTRCWPLIWDEHKYTVVAHQNVTKQVAQREALRQQSLTDPLTKLANRRHFESFLHHQWRRDMRNRTPLSVILIDLDYFKQFNDRHGHITGDECLRHIGQLLHRQVNRPDDLAVRYGGEEFILVLGNTPIDDAMMIANKIRIEVSAMEIPISGSGTGAKKIATTTVSEVTASLGVASIVPNRGTSESWLLELVDEALYVAKREGRNKVTFLE